MRQTALYKTLFSVKEWLYIKYYLAPMSFFFPSNPAGFNHYTFLCFLVTRENPKTSLKKQNK